VSNTHETGARRTAHVGHAAMAIQWGCALVVLVTMAAISRVCRASAYHEAPELGFEKIKQIKI